MLLLLMGFSFSAICADHAADSPVPGIPNFHRVDQNVYRGGQPTPESWIDLRRLGVKTVVDLRREREHSTTDEKKAVEAAGMRYVNVPMYGIVAPAGETVSKVLNLLQASDAVPVFVHCRQGVDRTGTIIACYRISHDGWRNEAALEEASAFGMHWRELGMKRYISRFLRPENVAGEARTK